MNFSGRASPPGNSGVLRRGDWLGLLAAAVIVGAVYAWALTTNPSLPAAEAHGWAHYPLMAEGWLQGRLDLPRAVPAGLLALGDPYNPKANYHYRLEEGLHDLSLYQGKLHLYFGPTPALVAFLPWRLLTGHALSTPWAVAGFCWVGFLAGGWLLLRVRRRYFPQAGAGVVLAGLLIIGLCNWAPVLLRRASVWEAVIACAYGCVSLSLVFLTEFLLRGGRGVRWLLLASLGYGLAIGARPNLAFGAIILVLTPFACWWREGRCNGWRALLRPIAAAVLPAAAVVALLLLYNYLRFDSPFEFGQKYQLASTSMLGRSFFGWRYFSLNLRHYFFSVPVLGRYFPFVWPAVSAEQPEIAGAVRYVAENVYGVLVMMPVLWLAPVAFWMAARWWKKGVRQDLAVLILQLGVLFAAVTFPLLLVAGAASRYIVDFVPWLALLAGIGLLALGEAWSRPGGWWRRLGILLAVMATAVSWVAPLLASIGHQQMFRADRPQCYRWLAHAFDRPAAWYESWRGEQFGPLRLTLQFPTNAAGQTEPLIITGSPPYSNSLLVRYVDAEHIRLIFLHNFAGPLGSLLRLDLRSPHLLDVKLGSLYPPREHPFFDGLPAERVEELATTVEFALDGLVVMRGHPALFDALSSRPVIGGPAPGRPSWRFSGKIISVDRRPFQ